MAGRALFCKLVPYRIKFLKCAQMSTVTKKTKLSMDAPGLLKIFESNQKRLTRIRFLAELFKANGFELRIAGGAVRDILKGTSPKDIDFATTAKPEQTLKIVSQHEDLLRVIVTVAGQRHGTVAVKFKEASIDFGRIKCISGDDDVKIMMQQNPETDHREPEYDDESPYEITTLRRDLLTDGRHADVEFINDWRVDAERRDLTINAMFLTLDDGRLIDYFDGAKDLDNGVVRFVGNAKQRIQEDYLRILRFFRFWSRYSRGKQPDDDTVAKLQDNLNGLEKISGERIWQEIKKTLGHLPCYPVIKLMLELKVFNHVGLLDDTLHTDYNEYKQKVLIDVELVEKNIERYCREVLQQNISDGSNKSQRTKVKELTPIILFASAVQSDKLCLNAYKRLKFSNFERDTILYLIENRAKCPSIDALKYQLAMSPSPERSLVLQRMTGFLISKGLFDFIYTLENWPVPDFPISGHIVSKAIHERKLPKKKTREVLEALKLEWSKNNYEGDRESLMRLMETKLDELTCI